MHPSLRLLLLTFSLAAGLRAAPWPEAVSDLPAHPGLHAGVLANGLRHYAFANAEPRDRISLRLVVAVGSLHEADDERGLAHFVEHMAFRSTRTHPAGSLVAALQRMGLGLGPDNTAFTLPDHTIYHLELPDAGEDTLREGLRVFREYAEELTFDAALIEKERGVILSEMAARNSPAQRSGLANLEFLFPDSRHARRPPIGTVQTLRTMKRAQFTAFYDAWYRPERMAVVAVGAVNPDTLARLVAEELGRMKPRGEPRPEPADLAPATAAEPDVKIFADPGLIGVGLMFQHPIPSPRGPDTLARRVTMLHESLAFTAFAARLNQIAVSPEASFVSPAVAIGPFLPGWRMASLVASGKIDDWRKVAGDLEIEHRRAFLHGFTASEIAEARANHANSIEQAVRSMAGVQSGWLASRIAASLVSGEVFVPPETYQRSIAAALAAATPEDCLRAFREAWTHSALHVFVNANPAFRITRHEFAAALNTSREREAAPRDDRPPPPFAYTDFGPAGRFLRDEVLADLDVRLTEFANGVRCNFKATAYAPDVVEIRVRVGEGRLTQPRDQPGLDTFASATLVGGGLGRHPAPEVARIIAGRSVGYAFQVEADAFVFTARCARRDLLLGLQLLAAQITDAAYRPETQREANARLGSMFGSLLASPSGPLMMLAPRLLLRGDPRFGPPLPNDTSARTLKEVTAWLEPQFKSGAIEMSVVGDVPWDEAAPALAATFGALPARVPRADTRAAAQAVKFAAPAPAPHIIAIDPKLGRASVVCLWPVASVVDHREERRCRVLAHVLADRLRLRLRDELGTTYTPSAGFATTPGFPHVNYFSLQAEVEPARAQQVLQVIHREVAALVAQGPGADEFTRAHQPYMQQMAADRRTNIYWGGTVLDDAQQHPARLTAARDRVEDVAAMRREELAVLAKRHLPAKGMFTFLGLPVAVTPASPPR
ncbi:MAG: insulinase family protein [Opitutaceae bacterium]|nr:insulinase family protein [Opitutaceae bacterium]